MATSSASQPSEAGRIFFLPFFILCFCVFVFFGFAIDDHPWGIYEKGNEEKEK